MWWFGDSAVGTCSLRRGAFHLVTQRATERTVNELLNSLRESFPSVSRKGIPVHQFETIPCDGSGHNGF